MGINRLLTGMVLQVESQLGIHGDPTVNPSSSRVFVWFFHSGRQLQLIETGFMILQKKFKGVLYKNKITLKKKDWCTKVEDCGEFVAVLVVLLVVVVVVVAHCCGGIVG